MITIKCDCCGKKIHLNGTIESYWGLRLEVSRYEGSDNTEEENMELVTGTIELDICNVCYRKAGKNKEDIARPKKAQAILDAAMGLKMFEMQPITEDEEA